MPSPSRRSGWWWRGAGALLLLGVAPGYFGVRGFVSAGHGRVARAGWPVGLEAAFGDRSLVGELSEEMVALGERLFFDPRFSSDGTVSCSSCHAPETAFADDEPLSRGVAGALGARNAPSVVNRLLGRSQFWDGRAASLEEQVLGPLYSPVEMAMDEGLVLQRLAQGDYGERFREVFGAEPSVTLFARAVAGFELTLVSGGAPFDRHEWLGDEGALGAGAKRGLSLFRGRARCTLCHTGTNFTDELFHRVGTGGDAGRATVTGADEDRGSYKTPTLRNVALTAPYMHDGSVRTLEEVVEDYDRGGRGGETELVPLHLEPGEKRDLVEFLGALTGPIRSVRVAELRRELEADR